MKKSYKKILSLVSAASLFAYIPAYAAAAYSEVRTYNGSFTDVSKDSWYYNDVARTYSIGLIDGKSDTTFSPSGNLTIAESIKLAVSCYQLLCDGTTTDLPSMNINWYSAYVNFAAKVGIVTEDYENYDAAASRAQVAVLFQRALRAADSLGKADVTEVNKADVSSIPDVNGDEWYAGAFLYLYKLGIMVGDADGKANPNSSIKRSDISAIAMRVIDAEYRVDLSNPSKKPSDSSETKSEGNTDSASGNPATENGSLKIYTGDMEKKSFTGVTGIAASFTISDGKAEETASLSLDLINDLVIEGDNISFKLYEGSGFEALGIVRGWLNDAALGFNGKEINKKDDVVSAANDLFRLSINENSVQISEIWYADHDGYTTYAFYFAKNIDVSEITSVDFICGKLSEDILAEYGLKALPAAKPEETKSAASDGHSATENPEAYKTSISNVKANASEVIFEKECARCYIVYGRGLLSAGSGDYRLIFVYKDGTIETAYSKKLESIKMNSSGDVLYFTVTAPDGKAVQYGVNFGN